MFIIITAIVMAFLACAVIKNTVEIKKIQDVKDTAIVKKAEQSNQYVDALRNEMSAQRNLLMSEIGFMKKEIADMKAEHALERQLHIDTITDLRYQISGLNREVNVLNMTLNRYERTRKNHLHVVE